MVHFGQGLFFRNSKIVKISIIGNKIVISAMSACQNMYIDYSHNFVKVWRKDKVFFKLFYR